MRHPHLSDDRLIAVCLQDAHGVTEQQHLAACAACQQRRSSLARLLDDTADVAAAEADVLFTDERLARQRAHILQRVEHESRQGQLISFPAGHAASPALLRRVRPASRWIAGAAAAGLLIGMLAGHFSHDFTAGRVLPGQRAVATPGAAAFQAVSTTLSEEEFLGRLEIAIEGPGGSALRPLDDLTPLVWEVAAQ